MLMRAVTEHANSNEQPRALPTNISREELLDAFRLFDLGHPHPFGPSTDYDVLYAGKRYPPKAIVGIAASQKEGRPLGPSEFRGGRGTWCFKVLTNSGFIIIPKGDLPIFPDEVLYKGYVEGTVSWVVVNKFERDRGARESCIRHYGAVCQGCRVEFEEMYGELGRGFIHVHHVVPLATIRKEYVINPIRDLRPVCPNCHAMLHRNREMPLTIENLRILINQVRRP